MARRWGAGRWALERRACGARQAARAEARSTRHGKGRATQLRGAGTGVGPRRGAQAKARGARARHKARGSARGARKGAARGSAGARPGRAGCALGALSLFDSVLTQYCS